MTAAEEERVRDAVSHHLATEAQNVRSISPKKDRRVYLVDLGGREVVLKVLNAKKVRSVGCEFAVERLREVGVPTPRTLAKDRSGRYEDGLFFDRPFVITEKADGIPLDKWVLNEKPAARDLSVIIAKLGGLLRKIHSVRVPNGFGAINDSGVGRFATWSDHLANCYVRQVSGRSVGVLDFDEVARLEILPREQVEIVKSLVGKESAIANLKNPRLLHNDLTLKNVLIDAARGEIEAIIDLHNMMAGDPVLELARFEYFYRGRGYLEPLLDGYGTLPEEYNQRRLAYLVFVLLEKLLWLQGREEDFPGRLERDLEMLNQTLEMASAS